VGVTNGLFENLSKGLQFYRNDQLDTWVHLCNEVFVRYVFALVYDEAMQTWDTEKRNKIRAIVYGYKSRETNTDNFDSQVFGGTTPPSISKFSKAIEKIHQLMFEGMNKEEIRKCPHLAALDELVELLEKMGLIPLRNKASHEKTLPVESGVWANGFENIFALKNPFLNGEATGESEGYGYSELICMTDQPVRNDQRGKAYVECLLYQPRDGRVIVEYVQNLLRKDDISGADTVINTQKLMSPNLYLRVCFYNKEAGPTLRYYRLSPFFVQFREGVNWDPWERSFGFFYDLNLPWRGKAIYIRMNRLGIAEKISRPEQQVEEDWNWLEMWLDRLAINIHEERQKTMIAFVWKDLATSEKTSHAGRVVQTQWYEKIGVIKTEKTCINLGTKDTGSGYEEFKAAVEAEEGAYLDIPVYANEKLQKLREIFMESSGRRRIVIRGEGGVGKTHTVLSALRNTYFRPNAVQPAIDTKHFEFIIFLTAKKTYYRDTDIRNDSADFSTRRQALEKIAMIINDASLTRILKPANASENEIETLKSMILNRDAYRPEVAKRKNEQLPSLLLIVDDLDSMTSEKKADTPEMQRILDRNEQVALVQDLADFCNGNPNLRVIMTTRYASFSGPDDELELPALGFNQTQMFVKKLQEFYHSGSVAENEVKNIHEISRGIPLYIQNLMSLRNSGQIRLENIHPAYRSQLEKSMAEFSYNTLNLGRHEGRMLWILREFIKKGDDFKETPLAFVRLLMYEINDELFSTICSQLESVYLFRQSNHGNSIQLMVRDVDRVIERSKVQNDEVVQLILDAAQIPTEVWVKTANMNNPNELLVRIAERCQESLRTGNVVQIRKLIEHITRMAETETALGYNMFSHLYDEVNSAAMDKIRELNKVVDVQRTMQWIPQMIELFQSNSITNMNVADVLEWLNDKKNLMALPEESGNLIIAARDWIEYNECTEDVCSMLIDIAMAYESCLQGNPLRNEDVHPGMLNA